MTTERCDQEIYERGKVACILLASPQLANEYCDTVARLSGQRVDWHYVGGRAVVKFIGSRVRVMRVVEAFTPRMVAV